MNFKMIISELFIIISSEAKIAGTLFYEYKVQIKSPSEEELKIIELSSWSLDLLST